MLNSVRRIIHTSRFAFHPARLAFLVTLLLSAFLAGQVAPVAAQSPITAEVDRTTIAANEQVMLTVSVSGDLLAIPTPNWTGLTDFRIVGSSTSTQVSIINGQLQSQGIFVFRLQPLREGNLVIPPLSIELGGQIYQSQPIEIQVLAGLAPIPPAGDEAPAPDSLGGQIFVEAEVDNNRPYLGQQIIYTFRFYLATRMLRQPDYQRPSFTNFWGQNILSQPRYNTTRDGREFVVSEIRTALFPASIGQTIIDPAKLVIPGGLFEPDTILETEPISVEVQPLPDGAPADFKGAVGQFEIRSWLSDATGQVNEPLTLMVEIEGRGNIEILTEPAFPELPDWRVFDSQSSTRISIDNDQVGGLRHFERLIVPGQPGDYTIPSISFSYLTLRPGSSAPSRLSLSLLPSAPVRAQGRLLRLLGLTRNRSRSLAATFVISSLYRLRCVAPRLRC